MRHSMQHKFVLRLRKHVGMQCDSALEHFHPSMGSESEMCWHTVFQKRDKMKVKMGAGHLEKKQNSNLESLFGASAN